MIAFYQTKQGWTPACMIQLVLIGRFNLNNSTWQLPIAKHCLFIYSSIGGQECERWTVWSHIRKI